MHIRISIESYAQKVCIEQVESIAGAFHGKNDLQKKTIDRISSPEQLSDYLKVTNPGIWITLFAVVLIIAGMIVWAFAGGDYC